MALLLNLPGMLEMQTRYCLMMSHFPIERSLKVLKKISFINFKELLHQFQNLSVQRVHF